MKKIILISTLSIAFPFLAHAEKAAAPAAIAHEVSSRLLVMPRSGLSPKNLEKIIALYAGRGRKIGKSNLHIVDLPMGMLSKGLAEALRRHPHLKFVEEDKLVKASAIPNDPFFGSPVSYTHLTLPTKRIV